ncbi:MAG: single-stranded DNA-binding protein [Cyanobacteria bacterium P01_C01_bin.72]
MNTCILMAEIVSDPELRSTQDQTSVSTMLVEFESTREGEAPGKVKVEGWGKLAEEIKNNYSVGNKIIIEGRLSMNLVEMPEGYKQKVAKLVASRIHPINGTNSNSGYAAQSVPVQQTDNVVDFAPPPAPAYVAPAPEATPEPAAAPTTSGNEDWDEIPFVRPVYSKTNFGSQLCDSWELEANRYWDGVK